MDAGTIAALITAFITLLLGLATLIVTGITVIGQIKAKRVDDKLVAQLNRLDKQLSDLYGPLYAWYEAGHENATAFRKVFSDDFSYGNKNYRVWAKQVFMRTNANMEELIVNNAELFVGEKIPTPFLKFCLHVAALKVYMAEWDTPGFDPATWKKYKEEFPHPGVAIHSYIRASFEVLKERQTRLLSGDRSSVSEKDLEKQIEERKNSITASFLKDAGLAGSISNLTLPPAKEDIDVSSAAPNKSFEPTADQRASHPQDLDA